jgi:hypothetical protein
LANKESEFIVELLCAIECLLFQVIMISALLNFNEYLFELYEQFIFLMISKCVMALMYTAKMSKYCLALLRMNAYIR